MLNEVRVGNIDDDVEKLLKATFIHESDENYPKDALHMYAENEPAMKRNDAVLNNLPGKLYPIEADDKILDNCKYPLATIQAAQNRCKSDYTVNLYIQNLMAKQEILAILNLLRVVFEKYM